MTPVRIAINGFGRIGRAFVRRSWNRPDIEIVAVNDLGSLENLAYLLKYDTVYRKWNHNISTTKNTILIDGKEVLYVSEKDSTKLPWKELDIDVDEFMSSLEGIGGYNESQLQIFLSGAYAIGIIGPLFL